MSYRQTRFFQRFHNIGIRFKIMGIVLTLIFLLGISVTFTVRHNSLDTLRSQLDRQGISVARDVAARSVDLIFTNNLFGLYQLVKDTIINNPDVRYVIILDQEGLPLANIFGNGLPEGLLEANHPLSAVEFEIEIIRTEEGLIHDFAIPVFEGKAGTVRVGMTEKGLQKSVTDMTRRIFLSTLVISLLGVAAAYALTAVLTKPIFRLVGATRAVAKGDLTSRVDPGWASDEISLLALAFNNMMNSLEQSSKEVSEYSKQLENRNEELGVLWQRLKEEEEMRTSLLKKVISAQEEERKRIARELHDQTSQSLTSLMLGLQALKNFCDSDDLHVKVEELRSLGAGVLDELHDLALELRPSILDDLGLVDAIEHYCGEYCPAAGEI